MVLKRRSRITSGGRDFYLLLRLTDPCYRDGRDLGRRPAQVQVPAPKRTFNGKNICVTGDVGECRNKPQIVVKEPKGKLNEKAKEVFMIAPVRNFSIERGGRPRPVIFIQEQIVSDATHIFFWIVNDKSELEAVKLIDAKVVTADK